MKKILIFCQAPSDVKYALTIYERNKNSSKIKIITINVKGMYEFLKSSNLKMEGLYHIPYTYLNLKNPISCYKFKKFINSKYKELFLNIKNHSIYYFSNHFDYITFSFLKRLSKNNTIFFVNHYDDQVRKDFKEIHYKLINIKLAIKQFYYYFVFLYITNIKLKFYGFNTRKMAFFPYYKFGIKEIRKNILDHDIYDKYGFFVNNVNKKSILLLETNFEGKNRFFKYKNKTLNIIKYLENKGYQIYLKPHPRLGYSKFLNNHVQYIINSYIPAEFIKTNSFDFIIGLSSSALGDFANRSTVNVYSLINLYQYTEESVKERSINYLKDLSSKIIFLDNIEDI